MSSLEFDSPATAQEQYNTWYNQMIKILNIHMPVKKMRVRERDAPYMNRGWKEAIRKKRKYAKRHNKLRTEESGQQIRKWRNIATRLRRNAIKQYWRDKSADLKDDPRSFYKTFTPFLRDKNSGDEVISLEEGDNIVQDQKTVTEMFSNYFATIVDGNGQIPPTANHPSVDKIMRKWSGNEFSFRNVTRSDVLGALQKLNPNRASGHDLIPARILRLAANEVATPLTSIYNRIITQATWPQQWKWGEWTPVFKNGDPLAKANYRPVTVLPLVDKIFEKLLCDQLSSLTDRVFDGFNSAYRKRYSCETTLVRLVEDWKSALDDRRTVGVLSMDMSKAFDSLVPSLLLSKLRAYGLSDPSVSLLESFFTGRKSRVRLGNVTSDWKSINRGCPQGSSLGPVLWNLYQNDVFYESTKSQLSAYADDHQLYLSDHDPGKVIGGLEEDEKVIADWHKSNHLTENLSKYQVLILSKSKQQTQTEAAIGEHTIEKTKEIKLLGVTLDERLDFSAHVKSVSIKTSRRIGVLSRLRKLIPVKAKLAIYKSAILPYFSYCSLVWHFCKASDRRKLERINERGLRTVFDNWKQPYEDLLRRAKLTTLTNKRLQDIATFMYKAKHKMLPPPVQELFTTGHTRYNLRNSDLFRTEHFNTKKYGKHALCYYGPSLWSKLDRKLRASTSLGSFKNAIKKMDLEALMSDCSTCSLCNS